MAIITTLICGFNDPIRIGVLVVATARVKFGVLLILATSPSGMSTFILAHAATKVLEVTGTILIAGNS
jgi:hypothetical protein